MFIPKWLKIIKAGLEKAPPTKPVEASPIPVLVQIYKDGSREMAGLHRNYIVIDNKWYPID